MIPREHYIDKIRSGFKYNPVVVLTGARQVGKTTLMEMFMENKQHLWLNGQNPETAGLFENYSTIGRYLQLNINQELKGWLVIDEFQYISKISLMLKLLTDQHKNLKILCSGSSSLTISREVEESLAGRVRMIPVYSLNFTEFLTCTDPDLASKFKQLRPDENVHALFPNIPVLLNEYLLYGGLPKVVLAENNAEKEELLNDIFQTYLLRDVRQYVRQQDFISFNKLLRVLSSRTGNLLNINELSNLVHIPNKTCEEYIDLLEQMFIIQLVRPFSRNKKKELSKMSKVFFCDIGLRNIIYNSFNDMQIRTDNGQLFENYVYLQLLQYVKPQQIYYYRTKDGTEIDFIVHTKKDQYIPIEAKYKHFRQPSRIRAITEFSKTTPVTTSWVINLNLNHFSEGLNFIQPYLLMLNFEL